MTTETKPIIDLSEWEECTRSAWLRLSDDDTAVFRFGSPMQERYFKRKPKPVKSLEEKVRETLMCVAGFTYDDITRRICLAVGVIEEHLDEIKGG